MTKFISTLSGRLINLADVAEITETKDNGRWMHRIHWRRGGTETVSLGAADDLDFELGMSAVVAAHPGFSVVVPVHDESGALTEPCLEPVIAWRVTAHSVLPVTIDVPSWPESLILYPDGRVVAPSDQSWDSLAVWLDSARRAHRPAQDPDDLSQRTAPAT